MNRKLTSDAIISGDAPPVLGLACRTGNFGLSRAFENGRKTIGVARLRSDKFAMISGGNRKISEMNSRASDEKVPAQRKC